MGSIKKVNIVKYGLIKNWFVSSCGESRYFSSILHIDKYFLIYIESIFSKFNNFGYLVGNIRIVKNKLFVEVNIFLYDWVKWNNDVLFLKENNELGVRVFLKKQWFYDKTKLMKENLRKRNFFIKRSEFKKKKKKSLNILSIINKPIFTKNALINFFFTKNNYDKQKQHIINKQKIIKKKKNLEVFTNMDLFRLIYLNQLLKEACFRYFLRPINLNYYIMNTELINSNILASYISLKLLSGEYLWYVLTRLKSQFLEKLLKKNIILGYHIVCKGRINKKSRASVIRIEGGKLSFSLFDNIIDISSKEVVLKYGKVSIGIWIVRDKSYKPYFYKVRF